MKKKVFFLGILVAVLCVTLFSCGMSTIKLVEDNISEITKVYYYGENDSFSASIACGERENDYVTNGKSDDLVDFCLLSVNLNGDGRKELIKAKIKIGDNEENIELLVNKKNDAYMIDLERVLTGEEAVSIEVNGETLTLQPISNDFQIDYSRALEIACENLEDKIVRAKSFTNLNAECYLRVLDKHSNDLEGTYWCFTVFNVDGENFSIIISTADGSIFAKSE